jgi:UPF0755 protein
MTFPGRGDPGVTDQIGTRGHRQGSVSSRELRGLEPVERGSGTWRGVLFLGVLTLALLVVVIVVAGPQFREIAFNVARDNPQAMRLPFVGDVVKERLGADLTRPAGDDDTPRPFLVEANESVSRIADNLVSEGFLRQPLAFEYLAVANGVDGRFQAGSFTLNRAMTPQQVVDRLVEPPDPPVAKALVDLRPGLRLEQIAAKLVSRHMEMDVNEFYQLALNPPADIRNAYPFLKDLPAGRSLEGYLGAGNFQVDVDISPELLLRMLLDDWQRDVGPGVIEEARQKHLDFRDVLTVASLVEKETSADAERARIAGVYWNRLDPDRNRTGLLGADPTVIYAVDSGKLRRREIGTWDRYTFWTVPKGGVSGAKVPEDLASYQTYQNPGLPDGPIATPTLASIRAALNPDTRGSYLYFYACPGSKTHKFAKTLGEHNRNIDSCPRRR